MTEVEWMSGQAPERMLELVAEKVSNRKRRLLAVACCRAIWPLLADRRSRAAVEVVERYADGLAGDELADAADEAGLAVGDLERAVQEARDDYNTETAWGGCSCPTCEAERDERMDEINPRNDPDLGYQLLEMQAAGQAACAAALLAHHATRDYWAVPRLLSAAMRRGGPALQIDLARLLHELIGNPFREVAIDPAWRTWERGVVVGLAQTIYEEKAFERLPILADALEDAGCAEGALLRHLRQPDGHLRGCWALDAVLGRR
jgi:hypothetical protein